MTPTAQIGTSNWHLVGITHTGGLCSHCPRTLKHVYQIRNTETGEQMTVGRDCCKAVTGWTLEIAKAQRMLRAAETGARREANWAKFTTAHPALAARIDADVERDMASPSIRIYGTSPAIAVKLQISEGREKGWERECAEQYLARA